MVLISGNLPFKTEVASVYIFGQIENESLGAAAAVSVVLHGVGSLVLLGVARRCIRGMPRPRTSSVALRAHPRHHPRERPRRRAAAAARVAATRGSPCA